MHGIEKWIDGRATFVAVKEHGWHRMNGAQGLSMEDLSIERAMELAHMSNLDYRLDPAYALVDGEYVEVPNNVALTRIHPFLRERVGMSTGMSERFELHTPEQVAEFGQAIIDEGQPLSALGLIDNGMRMFAAFRLTGCTIGGVDAVNLYLNIMSGFDGRMSTIARSSAIRVECRNTMNAVMNQASMPTYIAKHIGRPLEDRVDDARAALAIGWQSVDAFQQEANLLFDREITKVQFDKIVAGFLPIPDNAELNQVERIKGQRNDLRMVAELGTAKNLQGTAWGAWNALTEYTNWHAGRTSDSSRLIGQIIPGSRFDKYRITAMDVVREVVGV